MTVWGEIHPHIEELCITRRDRWRPERPSRPLSSLLVTASSPSSKIHRSQYPIYLGFLYISVHEKSTKGMYQNI